MESKLIEVPLDSPKEDTIYVRYVDGMKAFKKPNCHIYGRKTNTYQRPYRFDEYKDTSPSVY